MYRNEHLFTLYLGYETTDDSADSLDFDMNTVYGGAKFARVFCTAGNAAYYGKAEAMLAHTSTDVTRSIGGQQFTGSADTFSYGGAVHIGMNYSLGKSSVFTPEIGVGYTGGRMGDFDINGNIAAVSYEHYDSHTSNIGYGDLSLKWFQKWGTIVNTLLGGGTRVNFNRDMDVSSNISGVQGSSTVKLPRSYQWVNASLILDVNSNLDLFLKLLRTVKRRSSWLDAILICLTGEMFLYSGMAVRDHTQEVHVMGSDEIHIYHAAVVHDNNRETVSIGTDAAVISD